MKSIYDESGKLNDAALNEITMLSKVLGTILLSWTHDFGPAGAKELYLRFITEFSKQVVDTEAFEIFGEIVKLAEEESNIITKTE